jgi:NAD(P)-dependent dehydrogenase (short-subunit alcohol dehydrogenase family)
VKRDLLGRAAIVTGASSGLGRAAAGALAASGANVALLARSAQDLEESAADISGAGGRALPLSTDLADDAAIGEAVARVVKAFGRIDVLVNAAGTDAPGPVVDLSVDGWDRVMGVNVRAPFLLSKAVFARMRESGRGTIVNVSSVAGKRG